MTVHPVTLALLAVDTVAALALLGAAVPALRALAGWQPEAATRTQLGLERGLETMSALGRGGGWLLSLSALLLVVAVASVLPGLVPGAMCGTGVVQALGREGERALWLRGVAIGLLAAWHLVDRLDRDAPRSPLALTSARVLLLALPVALLAVVAEVRAFAGLDGQLPVDCCSVVYDQARRGGGAALAAAGSPLLLALLLCSVLLGGGALAAYRGARRGSLGVTRASVLWLLSWGWVGLASRTLTRGLAAYHFEVLDHECPWCLFAGRHRLVGYPLYGALALILAEGGAVALALILGRRSPELSRAASARAAAGAARLFAALCLFLALALGPLIAWRLRYGLWIEGGR